MHEPHLEPVVERINAFKAFVVGVVLLGSIVAFVPAMIGYFDYEKERATQRAEGTSLPRELRTLRVWEAEQLGSYGWIDKDKGRVRIPVERARELLLREGRR